ncbi:MAG: eamA 1 [Herbinix sp.]|nr:eamA 1 [Herbinix sp.]
MNKNKLAFGHLLSLFSIIVWGTTFISTKLLLRDFSPIEILFLRFIIALVVLILAAPRRLKITERKHELLFAGAGICGITLYFLLENIALTYSQAANIGVVLSIAPIFTAIMAHFILHGERLKLNFFMGFVVAIIGIGIISFDGHTSLKLNPIGDVLAILAAFVWGIYSVLTKKLGEYGYPMILMTRRIFTYGILFMIPAMIFMKIDIAPELLIKPMNIFNLLFLGIGASALCFVTWNYAVKLLGAIQTSIYIYGVPVITVITSIIVLRERITPMATVGIALTLIGLILSESRINIKRKKAANYAKEPLNQD